MQEPYNEGVAPHIGPEPCGGCGDAMAEALTGGSAGRLLSSEIIQIRVPTLWSAGEGNTSMGVNARASTRPGGVVDPGMHGHSTHGNRETSECPPVASRHDNRGGSGKAHCRTPDTYASEESDSAIVPEIRANNGAAAPAEFGEERTLTKRNAATEATPRTQGRIGVSFGRLRVRLRAEVVQPGAFSRLSGLPNARRRHHSR